VPKSPGRLNRLLWWPRRKTPCGELARRTSSQREVGSSNSVAHTAVRVGPGGFAGHEAAADGELAEVVLDCFGLMHAAEQSAALRERADWSPRWSSAFAVPLARHHHSPRSMERVAARAFRLYSTTALINMLRDVGFGASTAWTFDLYGGTVLLPPTNKRREGEPDAAVMALLQEERGVGVTNPDVLAGLQTMRSAAPNTSTGPWSPSALLDDECSGTAPRRGSHLVVRAGVDRTLLPAVADASSAKQDSGCQAPTFRSSHLRTCRGLAGFGHVVPA